MKITQEHLDFYRIKKSRPSFGEGIPVRLPSIDVLINSQVKSPKINRRIECAMSLIVIVRENKEAARTMLPSDSGEETLRAYMKECKCPVRKPVFARWLRRMDRHIESK